MKRYCLTLAAAIAVLALTTGPARAQWATLKGQFLYGPEGTKTPEEPKLTPNKDVEVCGKVQLFDESVVVNPENRGIANIILWVYKPSKVDPSFKASDADEVVIDNNGCRFDPHVALVRTTQTLRVKNSDPVGHNSLINFLKNPGINPIIPANSDGITVNLKNPELIPTPVSCSIHNWMRGYVMVQDHPYMAVTDADGRFELKNMPAGKLTIKVWHETAGYLKDATINGKKTTFSRGRYTPTMKAGADEDQTFVVDPALFKG